MAHIERHTAMGSLQILGNHYFCLTPRAQGLPKRKCLTLSPLVKLEVDGVKEYLCGSWARWFWQRLRRDFRQDPIGMLNVALTSGHKGSKRTFFGACTSICQLYVIGLARDADNRVIDSAGRCYNCYSLYNTPANTPAPSSFLSVVQNDWFCREAILLNNWHGPN